MAKAGQIALILYWQEGLAYWIQPGLTTPTPLIDTEFHLAAGWTNTGDEILCGHVTLSIQKPDGTVINLSPAADSNQDKEAEPGNGWTVQFEPVTLDQNGTWYATVTLTALGEVLVLDTETFAFAKVGEAAAESTDMISAVMPLIMIMMVMMMLSPMTKQMGAGGE